MEVIKTDIYALQRDRQRIRTAAAGLRGYDHPPSDHDHLPVRPDL